LGLPDRQRDAAWPAGETPALRPRYAARAVFFVLMDEPEYLICLECETPTYQFEFGANAKLLSVICNTCGNDNPSEFMTESELEEQSR
jgi:hypothetical protein